MGSGRCERGGIIRDIYLSMAGFPEDDIINDSFEDFWMIFDLSATGG